MCKKYNHYPEPEDIELEYLGATGISVKVDRASYEKACDMLHKYKTTQQWPRKEYDSNGDCTCEPPMECTCCSLFRTDECAEVNCPLYVKQLSNDEPSPSPEEELPF